MNSTSATLFSIDSLRRFIFFYLTEKLAACPEHRGLSKFKPVSASKLTLSWLNLARAKRITSIKVKHVYYCIQRMTTRYVVAQKSSSASRRKPDIHRIVFGFITATNAGSIYIYIYIYINTIRYRRYMFRLHIHHPQGSLH